MAADPRGRCIPAFPRLRFTPARSPEHAMLQEERLLRIDSLLAAFVRVSTERMAQELDMSR